MSTATHSIVDSSINILFWIAWFPRCQGNAVNMTFCGPARDTLLFNRKTEKLNIDTNYITIINQGLAVLTGR